MRAIALNVATKLRKPWILLIALVLFVLGSTCIFEIKTKQNSPREKMYVSAIQTFHARFTQSIHDAIEDIPVEGYVTYPGNETLKLHCSTCAYVTGSGHMLGSQKGAEIDSMQCVFRSNDAPTTGFEEDVGTKTTLRTGDRNSLRYITEKALRDHGEFDPYIVAKPSSLIVVYSDPYELLYEQLNKTHHALPDLRLHLFTPRKYHKVLDIFAERVSGNGVWASNGFITIYFAREVCDVIHVYGINEEKFCEKVFANETGYKDVRYHYYPKSSGLMNCGYTKYLDDGKTKTHHYTKEKAHYRLLIKEWGNIHFHAPEWPEQ